jgi:hypothetical protein
MAVDLAVTAHDASVEIPVVQIHAFLGDLY